MKDNKLFSCVGAILVIAIVFLFNVFFIGLALSILWNWFMVPVFDVATLTALQSYGLVLVACAVRGYPNTTSSTDDGKTISTKRTEAILISFIYPAALIVIGWIVHLII